MSLIEIKNLTEKILVSSEINLLATIQMLNKGKIIKIFLKTSLCAKEKFKIFFKK